MPSGPKSTSPLACSAAEVKTGALLNRRASRPLGRSTTRSAPEQTSSSPQNPTGYSFPLVSTRLASARSPRRIYTGSRDAQIRACGSRTHSSSRSIEQVMCMAPPAATPSPRQDARGPEASPAPSKSRRSQVRQRSARAPRTRRSSTIVGSIRTKGATRKLPTPLRAPVALESSTARAPPAEYRPRTP